MPRSKSQAVLRYLSAQRAKATGQGLAWEADDYQVAYLILLYALRRMPNPVDAAYLKYYGVHPEQLADKMAARDEALLGRNRKVSRFPVIANNRPLNVKKQYA